MSSKRSNSSPAISNLLLRHYRAVSFEEIKIVNPVLASYISLGLTSKEIDFVVRESLKKIKIMFPELSIANQSNIITIKNFKKVIKYVFTHEQKHYIEFLTSAISWGYIHDSPGVKLDLEKINNINIENNAKQGNSDQIQSNRFCCNISPDGNTIQLQMIPEKDFFENINKLKPYITPVINNSYNITRNILNIDIILSFFPLNFKKISKKELEMITNYINDAREYIFSTSCRKIVISLALGLNIKEDKYQTKSNIEAGFEVITKINNIHGIKRYVIQKSRTGVPLYAYPFGSEKI